MISLLRFLVPLANAATLTDKSSETASQSEAAVTSFVSFLWDRLDNWIAAIVVIVFSIYFAKTIKKVVVDRVVEKMGDEHEEVIVLVGRATYAAVLAVGMTIGLKVGGIDLTVIMAAVGFGIGFALQDIIMNFISGVILLATRQFAIGDFIEVNGILGKVKEIQARATILQALDGTKIIVPNSDLFTNTVTSFTTNPYRRIEIVYGVDYRADIKKTMNVMLSVIKSHKKVLVKPAPSVLLSEYGDSNINFSIRFWVESKSKWVEVKSDIQRMLKEGLENAGIDMAFNTVNLLLDKDTHKNVLPTYQLSADEMKQYKIEKIQAEEEQKTSDATNPDVQIEQPNVIEQTEHMDLDSKEQTADSKDGVSAPVVEVPAQPAPVTQPTTPTQPPVVAPAPVQPVAPQPAIQSVPETTVPLQPAIVTSGDVAGADFLRRE